MLMSVFFCRYAGKVCEESGRIKGADNSHSAGVRSGIGT